MQGTAPSTDAAAQPDNKQVDRPFSWRFTTPLYLGSALNPVNTSLIATALVPIAHGLNVSTGRTAALVTALYLASAIAQPTAGKSAAVFGARRVFLTGIALVAVGGLVGGVAQDLLTLLISRVLIGLGTSCAYPTAMTLVRARAKDVGLDRPPGGVLGGLQIAGTATATLGLPVGGLLVQGLGWRAVFFVNIPVALIAAAATLMWVPKDAVAQHSRDAREIATELDVIGIAGFAAAMITLLLFLFDLPTTRWPVLAASVVLWALLAGWEIRARSPFIDVHLLATQRDLLRTYLRFGLLMLCTYTVLYGITQWMETVRGLSEGEAGAVVLPMTLVTGLVIAPISRRNLVRGPLLATAVACLVASLGVPLLLNASGWLGWIIIVTIVFGIAVGAGSAGAQTALYAQARGEQIGTASGLLRTFGYVGSIASSAIVGIAFHRDVTDHGVHTIGWVMVGVSAALVLLTVADRSVRKPT